MRAHLLGSVFLLALAGPAVAQPVDREQVNRLLDEGSTRTEVAQTAQTLTDVIGPRLTNSPGMRKAEAWTQAKFVEWNLRNVRKEGFDFGRGWWIERSSVRMVAPRPIQLTAIPIAWTPATKGPITAPVIVAPIEEEADFAKWRGKLGGKIVMITLPTPASNPEEPPFRRYTAEDLARLDQFEHPHHRDGDSERGMKQIEYPAKLDAFLKAEGALAYAVMSRRDGKLVHGVGYQFEAGRTPAVPGVEIAAEDYRRLARLAKIGPAPTVEIDSDVRFDDSDTKAYNVIAEIPGTDRKAGYVMAGAHLDSWAAADGAADNAAGVAMVMEAARIIAATGVRPRRTIRFALWSGEEQGMLGSLDYLAVNLADRGGPGDPQSGLARYMTWGQRWPIKPRPGWGELVAYFNLDHGSGRIRGIYAENNAAVVPIFREWLAPFGSMGASSVVIRKTGGTDHTLFQQLGLPAFQFIQDPLDYGSRLHHTNADTFDHLEADDLRQGSVILASFLVNAANADKPLPRAPMPRKPNVTDPFAYSKEKP